MSRQVGGGVIVEVNARHDGKGSRDVGRRVPHDAHLVKRRPVGDHAPAGKHAVGRLEPVDPAVARGQADGTARLGAEGKDGLIGGKGCGRTAGGAAGNVGAVNRVTGRPVAGILGGRAHRELVLIAASERDGPRLGKPLDDRRAVGGDIALQNLGRAGQMLALHGDVVLHGKGNAQKRLLRKEGLHRIATSGTRLRNLLVGGFREGNHVIVYLKEGVERQGRLLVRLVGVHGLPYQRNAARLAGLQGLHNTVYIIHHKKLRPFSQNFRNLKIAVEEMLADLLHVVHLKAGNHLVLAQGGGCRRRVGIVGVLAVVILGKDIEIADDVVNLLFKGVHIGAFRGKP